MKKWGNALPFLTPGTFKTDCVIYQHGPSDATGEFRRAGVNEASNDNLAVEENCRKREQNGKQRTPAKYPCLCIVTLTLLVSYFHRTGCIFRSLSSFFERIRMRYDRQSCKNSEREDKKKKEWRTEAKKRAHRRDAILSSLFFFKQ